MNTLKIPTDGEGRRKAASMAEGNPLDALGAILHALLDAYLANPNGKTLKTLRHAITDVHRGVRCDSGNRPVYSSIDFSGAAIRGASDHLQRNASLTPVVGKPFNDPEKDANDQQRSKSNRQKNNDVFLRPIPHRKCHPTDRPSKQQGAKEVPERRFTHLVNGALHPECSTDKPDGEPHQRIFKHHAPTWRSSIGEPPTNNTNEDEKDFDHQHQTTPTISCTVHYP